MQEILNRINEDIADCLSGRFKFNLAEPSYIPQEQDEIFVSAYGLDKQGASMISCVLVVNIRNINAIIDSNQSRVTGKIYAAFVKSVHRIAKIYQAELHTVQLDKMVLLFPTRHCFRNAVECAVTINTILKKMFDKHFNLQGLKLDVGMGIAHGQLLAFKADSSDDTNNEMQNEKGYTKIIWTGQPMTTATKLSEIAAYVQKTELVKVGYSLPNPYYPNSNSVVYKTYFHRDFLDTLLLQPDSLISNKGKIIKIEPFILKENLPPILLTAVAYHSYLKRVENPEQADKEGWQKITTDITGESISIFGGDIVWDI
jgi:adenylate cyclase